MIALFVLALATAELDPAQEARAQSLEREIRCVVCENEPIAQSTADIAADMRALVRERVAAGDSDEQIRRFFRDRYGDFVLLRPPFDMRTWALWGTPILLLGAGFAAVRSVRRGRMSIGPDGGMTGEGAFPQKKVSAEPGFYPPVTAFCLAGAAAFPKKPLSSAQDDRNFAPNGN